MIETHVGQKEKKRPPFDRRENLQDVKPPLLPPFLTREKFRCINLPQVGWLRAEDQTILSMGDRRVTHSPRFFVTLENAKTKNQTQSREDEEATWQLHIRALKEADRGCYMCQLNTKPMLSQLGCVDVLGMPNCTRYVAFPGRPGRPGLRPLDRTSHTRALRFD